MNKSPDWLHKIEWTLAILLTLLVVFFQVTLLFHAGGLWRDEINTVEISSLPSLGDIWKNLQFDSFPMLWFLVVRTWTKLGLESDLMLRLLGCLVGLGIIAMLWINARRCKISLPIFSLALLVFSPTVLRFGDSMRAYGFGTFLFLVTFGMIWKVIEAPTRKNIFLAAVAAVLSVHALYYNAVLLLAIGSGAMVVALRHRNWKQFSIVLGIGMIAAISILPYLGTIRGAADWNMLVQNLDFDFSAFWEKISEAIGAAGSQMVWIWTALLIFGLVMGLWIQWQPQKFRAAVRERDLALFSLTVLLVGVVGYFIFLKLLKYFTSPWYYVALMALVAVALETIFSILMAFKAARILRIIFVVAVVTLTFRTTLAASRTRFTNIDSIARELNQKAAREDFILLDLWYLGLPFQRYYQGAANWMTLPPISFHKFHRYDLIKEKMMAPTQLEAIRPVLEKIAETLRAGHRVWIVGSFDVPDPGQPPPVLPPAPQSPWGWADGPYAEAWMLQVGYFIQTLNPVFQKIEIPSDDPVSKNEHMPLFLFQGRHRGADEKR